MNRLLVASRRQPDIDLPKYLGMPEFSVVPLSLFMPDGSLYYLKDKAVNATELRNLQVVKENQSIEEEFSSDVREVIVIDSMTIVNNINTANSQISNRDDLAKCFTDMITNGIEDCDQFWIGFHRYDPHSLKNNTRSNRTKELSAVQKVSYTTRTSHQFLSSIIEKNELTEDLSKKLPQCMTK